MNDDLPYLKQVSRLKHRILAHYLAPWAAILGSAHPRLRYVDCFAGGGRYVDEHGVPLDGSPVIALRTAQAYLRRNVSKHLALHFVESDSRTAQQLRDTLGSEEVLPNRLSVKVHEEGAEDFARKFLQVPRQRSTQIPTFIFIDPYGHPIPVPLIRTLLTFPRVEVFVNLMWYRINMDLSNQKSQEHLNKLFGHTEWQSQSVLCSTLPSKRERGFVDYLLKQIGNQHHAVRIPMPFSPEDQVPGGEQRTKYYLLHLSTHRKAALLMKDVMLKAREEELAGLTPADVDPRARIGISVAGALRRVRNCVILRRHSTRDLGLALSRSHLSESVDGSRKKRPRVYHSGRVEEEQGSRVGTGFDSPKPPAASPARVGRRGGPGLCPRLSMGPPSCLRK